MPYPLQYDAGRHGKTPIRRFSLAFATIGIGGLAFNILLWMMLPEWLLPIPICMLFLWPPISIVGLLLSLRDWSKQRPRPSWLIASLFAAIAGVILSTPIPAWLIFWYAFPH